MKYFIEAENSLDWMERKIRKEEFAAREEEALRCTLDSEKFMNMDEIYLTEMELSCICKSIKVLDIVEKKKYIEFLLRYFKQYENKRELSDFVVMYEFVMICMASEIGNMGNYQAATNIDMKVLREILRCRRIWSVSNLIYDIIWNQREQEKCIYFQGEKEIMTERLQECIILSHFYRQKHIEKFLCEKMNQV